MFGGQPNFQRPPLYDLASRPLAGLPNNLRASLCECLSLTLLFQPPLPTTLSRLWLRRAHHPSQRVSFPHGFFSITPLPRRSLFPPFERPTTSRFLLEVFQLPPWYTAHTSSHLSHENRVFIAPSFPTPFLRGHLAPFPWLPTDPPLIGAPPLLVILAATGIRTSPLPSPARDCTEAAKCVFLFILFPSAGLQPFPLFHSPTSNFQQVWYFPHLEAVLFAALFFRLLPIPCNS